MKKHFFALLLALLLLLQTAGATYSDVAGETLTTAVTVLSQLAILSGDDQGAFQPQGVLTRSQLAKLAVVINDLGEDTVLSSYVNLFNDVPATHWAHSYVNLAYQQGYLTGYGDGTFGPDDAVTVAQGVTVALRLLGYSGSKVGTRWPEDYMAKAVTLGLMEGGAQDPDAPLTRGEAARLLYAALKTDTDQGKPLYESLVASVAEDVLILDTASTQDEGDLLVWQGNGLTNYTQKTPLDTALENTWCTLLFSDKGQVIAALPQEEARVVTISDGTFTEKGVTSADGISHVITQQTVVVEDLDDGAVAWDALWYDLLDGTSVTLYYGDSGKVFLAFCDMGQGEAWAVTGFLEDVLPNEKTPNTVTVLGVTYPVAEESWQSLSQWHIGDLVTLALDGVGVVVDVDDPQTLAVYPQKLEAGTLVAVHPYAGSDTDLLGTTVTKAVTYHPATADLVVSETDFSPHLTVYEQVGDGPLVEIGLTNIGVDTIPKEQIRHLAYSASGTVICLVLDDLTGACYTYGILTAGTQTSQANGGLTTKNRTVTVANQAGTTTLVTGQTFTDGQVGAITANTQGKCDHILTLTAVEHLTRDNLYKSETLIAQGITLPISDNVVVYNQTTKKFITLAQAKAYQGDVTAYYDKTPATGGQVRVLVVT